MICLLSGGTGGAMEPLVGNIVEFLGNIFKVIFFW